MIHYYLVGVLSEEEKKKILRTLREDEEFRYAVAGLLGLETILNELRMLRADFQRHLELEEMRWRENDKRWEENNKRWEENNRRWEENNKRWEENNRRWEEAYKRFEAIEAELKKLREDHNKLREDFNRQFELFSKRLDSFERRLIAMGARWGVESEETFREAMKNIVEEILGAGKVEKWRVLDEEGVVLGYKAEVEVDVLIKDKVHILIEVKSSASESDVFKLWRIGKLYEKKTGVKPRLVMVTPFPTDKALEAAKNLGVEIYTRT
jgi:hypothetical protein